MGTKWFKIFSYIFALSSALCLVVLRVISDYYDYHINYYMQCYLVAISLILRLLSWLRGLHTIISKRIENIEKLFFFLNGAIFFVVFGSLTTISINTVSHIVDKEMLQNPEVLIAWLFFLYTLIVIIPFLAMVIKICGLATKDEIDESYKEKGLIKIGDFIDNIGKDENHFFVVGNLMQLKTPEGCSLLRSLLEKRERTLKIITSVNSLRLLREIKNNYTGNIQKLRKKIEIILFHPFRFVQGMFVSMDDDNKIKKCFFYKTSNIERGKISDRGLLNDANNEEYAKSLLALYEILLQQAHKTTESSENYNIEYGIYRIDSDDSGNLTKTNIRNCRCKLGDMPCFECRKSCTYDCQMKIFQKR